MSESLPEKNIPSIECVGFQLIDEPLNNYVLRANNVGEGSWQVGGGSSENIDCKTFRLSTDPGAGLIMTSDAIGNGTWEPFPNTDDVKCTSFQLTTAPVNNYVLTSNSTGVGSWQEPVSNTPSKGLQYTLLESNIYSSVLANTNTAIIWSSTANTINNLVVSGKQIQNISNQTMYLMVSFNVFLDSYPGIGQAWINTQPTTDDPNNPATLEYAFNGLFLTTNAAQYMSIIAKSIVILSPGSSMNMVVKTNVQSNYGSITENEKTYCQIFRVA